MHPFMPYITEELWQRLPKSEGDTTPTIMLAPYPVHDPTLEFEEDARDYELGLECAQAIRSLTSEYGVRSDGHVFIKASATNAYTKVNEQISAIKALCGRGVAQVDIIGPDANADAIPDGCAVFVLTAEISVLLELGSRLTNIDAEIKKVQTKLLKSQGFAKKQEELMSKEGFEDKVSDVVLTAERKKLADARAATENYQKTIEQFEKMKLASK